MYRNNKICFINKLIYSYSIYEKYDIERVSSHINLQSSETQKLKIN